MHWISDLDLSPELNFGFVYMITNKISGRSYIGSKQYWTTTNIRPRNVRKKMVIDKESNWKTYTSSSNDLNIDIALHGKDNFEFRILSEHKTKRLLQYYEMKTIYLNDALLLRFPDGNRQYYNKCAQPMQYLAEY